jgi:hypothetical protein
MPRIRSSRKNPRFVLAAFACFLLFARASIGAVETAPSSADPRFDIWEYQVEGNSLVAAVDIERAVYSHLGPDKSIDDVEAARAALESL